MSTEHTPGPWTLEISDVPQTNKPFCGICGADGAGIVYATLRAPGELIANARLIAAAPDLLAALQALHACHRGFSSSPDWGALDDEARAAAESAIAKATGEETNA
jgi:hypothetical protein